MPEQISFLPDEPKKEEKQMPEKYLEIYDRWETMSAFVKAIRLGKVEDALYWLEVMIKGEADLPYIARRLMIEAQESGYGPTPAIYASSVFHIVTIGRSSAQDALFQLTRYLCRCTKWWENEQAREDVKTWFRVEKEVKKIKDGESLPRAIPDYAIDKHTAKGKARMRAGEQVDERFSGSERGILSIIKLYEKYGRLNEHDYLEDNDMREIYRDVYYKK